MPELPSAPSSRVEQYLNAIATLDYSGIPDAPSSRVEQYLDYIIKNSPGLAGVTILVDGNL